MSRGQLARTPANFPKMKHRAAGRLNGPGAPFGPRRRRGHFTGTYTGGYYCSEHGIRWTWTDVDANEMDEIEQDIAEHEDYHYSLGEDTDCGCGCATGDE